jgi:hypothetical protein
VTRNRLTVEELAKDALDVRELYRAGLLIRPVFLSVGSI